MIGSAYIMVVVGILLAKGVGFYRDMVFAGVFGTGAESDIYFQVFGLVNLIFTGIGVALSTLVIKNLNKAENAGRDKIYAASFLRKSILYLIGSAVVLVILAKPIVTLILPEVKGESFDLAVRLMYIMSPSLIFVVVAYIISGLLQNKKVFFITSIMSLPFNVAIIIALFFKNVSIETVGIVTTIGWFLHIAVQLPSFYRKGYSFLAKEDKQLRVKSKNPEIIWIFASNMMFQLCVYIDRAFVSGTRGIASTFNYASNLFITIASVFVVAMSTVVFPAISKNYEEGNKTYVNELIQYIVSIMFAIFLPFLLVVGLFGEDLIRLIYQRGAFGPDSTTAVATMFFIYSLGVLGYLAQELFNKVIYLAGKYKYTVSGTLTVIILNVLSNLTIKALFPAGGEQSGIVITTASLLIAASTSVLITAYAVFIAIVLKKVIGKYWTKDLVKNIIKIFVSGGLSAIAYVLFNSFKPSFAHGYLSFAVVIIFCGTVYIASLYVTGVLKQLIKRKTEE
ncbi:MAG: lipid II flippase MurJ [Bacillota bacterium]|nr:lipid II flippase MurJ [Bacillota bacterium]